MNLRGRFRVNLERSLPAFHAVDEVSTWDATWASKRHYELSWLGWTLSWEKIVDRPLKLSRSVEPWEWIDRIVHFFRSGF